MQEPIVQHDWHDQTANVAITRLSPSWSKYTLIKSISDCVREQPETREDGRSLRKFFLTEDGTSAEYLAVVGVDSARNDRK